MHVHVENVADRDAYELIAEPINEQQQVEEVELIEGPTQGSEEPKAIEEGKHRSMTQSWKI